MKYIIPKNMRNLPEPHELEIAEILFDKYKTKPRFIEPFDGYKVKTPDIILNYIEWEIKSPTTKKSKDKIRKNISKAGKKTPFVIIDSHRTKVSDQDIEKIITAKFNESRTIQKIIWIKKDKKIVEIFK